MAIRPLLASVAAVSFLLAGCASADDAPASSAPATTQAASSEDHAALLADYGLTGMDARTAIDHLDRLGGTDRPADLMASIRTDELLLAANTVETTLDMPEDSFYVSIAPYVNKTHDCFYHSLTTCQGEMPLADVEVTVVDETGTTILDEEMTTYENGFVGLWLPRDMTGTITVTADGKSVESPISTMEDSATCLTTLQLA